MKHIVYSSDRALPHYFDKNFEEIHEGDILMMNGREEKVYLTDGDTLGTDATNPVWLKNGRAYPCQYGIYPLNHYDLEEAYLVKK